MGNCEEGYSGNLCNHCESDYYKSFSNECIECHDLTLTYILLTINVVVGVGLLSIVVYTVIKTSNDNSSIISIYLRILINFIQ